MGEGPGTSPSCPLLRLLFRNMLLKLPSPHLLCCVFDCWAPSGGDRAWGTEAVVRKGTGVWSYKRLPFLAPHNHQLG